MPTKKWSEEEEEFLKSNFINLSNAELAEKFEITKNAVQKKLARMGLKRSQLMKDESAYEIAQAEVMEEEESEAISTESHFFQGNMLFHEEHDYKQAVEEYRQALDEELSELIKLKTLYWMAESHLKVGETEEALDLFKELAEKHGSTYLGDSARRRIEAIAE